MELDELKQTWQQASINNTSKNTDIMDLIQHKSYGPIAAMKRNFRKEIIMMCIIPFVLLLTNLDNVPGVLTSIMFWSYVAFCIGVIAFASYSYSIVDRMGKMDRMVRTNLEQQIHLLEARLKQNIIGIRIAMIYFIVLTEVVPYFQHYRTLAMWHSLSPFARYGTYAGLLLLQYFVSRKVVNRKFGTHLNYLRQLARELQ